jgi:hypothetical protein
MLNPVLRRYTPPTCSLEISANRSPLSQWTDQPVLKQVRFQLSFDDPRLPLERQVTVRGDRAQLESLCEVVSLYVQRLLEPESLQLDAFHLYPEHSGIGATAVEEAAAGVNLGLTSVESVTRSQPTFNGRAEICSVSDRKTGILLQPKGLVSHELHLGVLANEESGDRIHLSALQLFDLANALDDYTAEALALPTLQRPTWLRTQPVWMQAAAVLVLAVGITTPVLKFALNDDSAQLETASQPTSIEPAQTEVGRDPASVDSAPTPTASTRDQRRANRRQNLPSPPVATPGQASPVPTIAVAPTPAAPAPAAPQAPTGPSRPTSGQAGANTSPLPQVAIAPAPDNSPAAPPTLQLPSLPIAPQAPIAPANPEAAAPESSVAPFATSTMPADAPNAALAPQTAARSRATPSSTAFDVIPQVAEARAYFQERWTVPEGLTQTLEYQLVIGADGTVQQIIPLGQASRTYVNRTEMPLIGEPFVAPLETGQTARLRLVLTPEGRVQTFLEAMP